MTQIYTVFHLNMFFSSIEEERRKTVLEKCYWPLLSLIEETPLRAGIEAPAVTLQIIDALDPSWTAKLRTLIADGRVELIGSGHTQLIGPLVPAEVNAANLRIGHAHYEQLLGVRPRVALVNEQAYASGLLRHYLDAGYTGLVMEWNNAAREHPEWPDRLRLAPATAVDQYGRALRILWNDSVTFQKFQRFAHDEIDLPELLGYLHTRMASPGGAFCLYGNDVEIFDFRPGRFAAEARIHGSEWARIRQLVTVLAEDPAYSFALPSEVLASIPGDQAPRAIESSRAPILVKKQLKYNVTRWAVTGRNDLGINSACWRIWHRLVEDPATTDAQWQELCELWSSDFRTHTTAARWCDYLERLHRADAPPSTTRTDDGWQPLRPDDPRIEWERRAIVVSLETVKASLSLRRGLALDRLVYPEVSPHPLAGTIAHGTLADIAYSADWYTGNLVLEAPGAHKVTDLEPVRDLEVLGHDEGGIRVRGIIDTRLGPIIKTVTLGHRPGVVEISYQLQWTSIPRGSLRLGILSLVPSAFDERTLMYRTHNGGIEPEHFRLQEEAVDHGAAVSFLVSAANALGMTGSTIEIGDRTCVLRVEVDKSQAALVGMVTHRRVGQVFFSQLQFSAMELDDTSLAADHAMQLPSRFVLRYSAERASWAPLPPRSVAPAATPISEQAS